MEFTSASSHFPFLIVKYLIKYGGWGIRYGPEGRVYTMSCNREVEIELKDGKN